MIIDGVSEGLSGVLDRDSDVMTSPVHLLSFYGCSSPAEPILSDSEQSCSSAGSPHSDGVDAHGARIASLYQGVRVKNTVKQLILQKRHYSQGLQYQVENTCPALINALQRRKRELENPSVCPDKRLRVLDSDSNLFPCGESMICDSEMLEDFGERLSIESVTVRGFPQDLCTGAQSHQNTFPSSSGLGLTAAPPVSFFQWQIQQEEERLASVSPGELTARDADGDTFLHIAVAQGRRALAYVLARRMAALGMLDMKEHNNQSGFQVSVAADQHLIAQDLLQLGAELNTRDCWGRAPLHVCAEKGHSSTLQAIQRSVQTSGRPVNLELLNYDGLTPLHVAVLSHNAVLQELSRGPCAQSPALLQKKKLLVECVNTLLLMGASLEAKDCKSGRTVLHMAAEEANVELLRLFLDQSNYWPLINARAFSGNTALHMVSALQGRRTQLDAVRLLLRRGADPSTKNLEHEQPAQLVPDGPLGEQVRRILKGKGAQSRS
ncbi:NF-kappa-B inhibitor zeta [Carassius carassius]|uniref:NF-kappa-B inhibitor zeta n=1 Tax=Carassius carassius TaxID=217509 RepID=UPI00286914D4|nr:NF-kappa-B inhibitor zeta [Carassius carassius]